MPHWSQTATSVEIVEFARKKTREFSYFRSLLDTENWSERRDESEVFDFLISAALSAARSVTRTFWERSQESCLAWHKHLLTDDDDLMTLMRDCRDEEVHRGGTEKDSRTEYFSLSDPRLKLRGRHEYFGPPGMPEPRVGLPVYYFERGGKRVEVTECFKRFGPLVEKLIGDYQKTPW